MKVVIKRILLCLWLLCSATVTIGGLYTLFMGGPPISALVLIAIFGSHSYLATKRLKELFQPEFNEQKLIECYRREFAKGPVGKWRSYLGGGADNVHGLSMKFDRDGTGVIDVWDSIFGTGGQESFAWEVAGERRICINLEEEGRDVIKRLVEYDFYVWRNEYDHVMVGIYETAMGNQPPGECKFWVSGYKLYHVK